MNPLEDDVALLLGGGDPENKPTLEDMQTKALAFEDILPILWALSQYKEPGNYSDFCEALKVNSCFLMEFGRISAAGPICTR